MESLIILLQRKNTYKEYSTVYLNLLVLIFHILFINFKRQQCLFSIQSTNIPFWRDRQKHPSGEIGTHTLRKTFGYHAYQNGSSLELLMDIFNHSSKSQTLRYIGITEEQKKEVYLQSNLG
jgi:integrase